MSIMAFKRTLAVQVQREFELFEFILGEDASECWREITICICDGDDRVDKEGDKQTTKCGQSWVTLSACRREFMLQIFAKNAAEQQHYYLQFCIRKSPRIKLRPFVRRLLNLSRSIQFLPCLKDCSAVNRDIERMSRPFMDFKLCGIIMRSCPQVWQDTYFLHNKEVPTNVERILEKYEAIKQLKDTKKRVSNSKDERARKKAKKVAANGTKSSDEYRIPTKQSPSLSKTRKGKMHCHR